MLGQKKLKGLNILIVGCGRVGFTLVEQLSSEGHDITVIDQNSERIDEITERFDIMGVIGNGANFKIQKEAGIMEADLLVAVTDSDELNLLCCAVASQAPNCATIARVRNPAYGSESEFLREKLGLAMIINPEFETSREISRILSLPGALEVNTFAHGHAELVKFKITNQNTLHGMSIAKLGSNTENILACVVERNGEVTIPSGDYQLQAGDVVSFIAPKRHSREFLNKLGSKTNKVKNTMIVGGGKSGFYLAKQLLQAGIDVKIIEKDFNRCELLNELLPKAEVICGDGSDEQFLVEEGIERYESFVPLTGSDEENILLTLFANHISDSDTKVVTKIDRITFNDVINNLDLGSIIYPKYLTAEAIIAYVRERTALRSSNIEALSHMYNRRVEAIEFKVDDEQNELTGIPLNELKLKKNVLISFINRHGKIIIPGGYDRILPGDTVMIVTTVKGFTEIGDILY